MGYHNVPLLFLYLSSEQCKASPRIPNITSESFVYSLACSHAFVTSNKPGVQVIDILQQYPPRHICSTDTVVVGCERLAQAS